LYDLVDAVIRLGLVELHSEIKNKVESNNFSRDAYDVSILLTYFGHSSQVHKDDQKVFEQLLRDVSYLQADTLRSQHLEYLVRGLSFAFKAKLVDPEQINKILVKFMPKLIDSIYKDLTRFGFRSIINSVTHLQ